VRKAFYGRGGSAGDMSGLGSRGAVALLLLASPTVYPCAPEDAPKTGERFVIVGAVTMSKDLVRGDVQMIPITLDARFGIRVRIERIVSGDSPWKLGSEQVFVIHSPVRMFGNYDLKGEKYRFTFEKAFRRLPIDRSCRYCVTDVRPEEASGQ